MGANESGVDVQTDEDLNGRSDREPDKNPDGISDGKLDGKTWKLFHVRPRGPDRDLR